MKQELYRYYSQGGEDCLLLEFFDYKNDGFYVDVGAFDGVHLSNSLTFELLGWKGVCVEPNPKYAGFCMKARPNSKCVQVACSRNTGESLSFYEDELGLLSSLEMSDEKNEDIKKRYLNRGLEFKGLAEIIVPVKTLDQILKDSFQGERGMIDFISIDVEGHEMDVLKGFDIKFWRPRVIVIEANTPLERESLISFMLDEAGYMYSREVGVNLFFVSNVEDKEKLNNIILKCVIEKQLHPLGISYTPNEYIEGKVVDEMKDRRIAENNRIIADNKRTMDAMNVSILLIKSSKRYVLANILLYPWDKARDFFFNK